MKRMILAAILLCGSAAATAQKVEVGEGNWANVPKIEPKGALQPSDLALHRLHQMAEERACEVPGLRGQSIDVKVPFVIQFAPAGGVERIVVRRMNCPQLEALMGSVIRKMVDAGEFVPTGENQTGWYRSELAFLSR